MCVPFIGNVEALNGLGLIDRRPLGPDAIPMVTFEDVDAVGPFEIIEGDGSCHVVMAAGGASLMAVLLESCMELVGNNFTTWWRVYDLL